MIRWASLYTHLIVMIVEVASLWEMGFALACFRTARSRKLSDSKHHRQQRQHQRSHAAPTDTRARTRISTDTVDFHPPRLPRYRCSAHCQWRHRIRPDSVFRKTFSSSGSRTSQRCQRWARKAVGSKEEWRYEGPPLHNEIGQQR